MKPSVSAPTTLLLAASLRANICAEKACSQAAETLLACTGPTFAEWAACICPHSSWPEVIAACLADCEPLNPAFLQFCVGSSVPAAPEVTEPVTTSVDSDNPSNTKVKTTAESEVPAPEPSSSAPPEPTPPAPTETPLFPSQLPDPTTTTITPTLTLTLTPTPARPKYTVTGHAVPFAPTPDTCTRLTGAALAAVAAVGAVSIVVWV